MCVCGVGWMAQMEVWDGGESVTFCCEALLTVWNLPLRCQTPAAALSSATLTPPPTYCTHTRLHNSHPIDFKKSLCPSANSEYCWHVWPPGFRSGNHSPHWPKQVEDYITNLTQSVHFTFTPHRDSRPHHKWSRNLLPDTAAGRWWILIPTTVRQAQQSVDLTAKLNFQGVE